jgi:hypothetical protein
MHRTARRPKIVVSADGTGLVSQAGGLLLAQTLRATGLDRGLSGALERWRAPRAAHDPGKIITDLAVTLALGGDCLDDQFQGMTAETKRGHPRSVCDNKPGHPRHRTVRQDR